MIGYAAIPVNGHYRVARIGPCGDFTCIGDFRSFNDFDEANQVAKESALGKYGCKKGYFINMR